MMHKNDLKTRSGRSTDHLSLAGGGQALFCSSAHWEGTDHTLEPKFRRGFHACSSAEGGGLDYIMSIDWLTEWEARVRGFACVVTAFRLSHEAEPGGGSLI